MAGKARSKENERLGSFMKSFFTTSSKSYENDAFSNDLEPLKAAGDKEEEDKGKKGSVENTGLDNLFDAVDENQVADEVEVVQDPINLSAFDSVQEGYEKNV